MPFRLKRHTVPALAVALIAGVVAVPTEASAESCFDLWYRRNLIYAENGYCFKTDLGKRTFADYDCWTSNPNLSKAEQRRVDGIRAEEKRLGCKVN